MRGKRFAEEQIVSVGKLKRIVAGQMLDIQSLKVARGKKYRRLRSGKKRWGR